MTSISGDFHSQSWTGIALIVPAVNCQMSGKKMKQLDSQD